MDRFLNMFLRRVMGQLVNRGVNAGVERVARTRAGGAELTRDQRQSARKSARNVNQLLRTARRLMRR